MLEQSLSKQPKSVRMQSKFYTKLRFEMTTTELVQYAKDRNIDVSNIPLKKRKSKQYLVNRILLHVEQVSA